MMTLTLTPCRSNPRRYVNLVVYRRVGDRVVPSRLRVVDGRETVEKLYWDEIGRDWVCDPEFARAWAEHIAGQ